MIRVARKSTAHRSSPLVHHSGAERTLGCCMPSVTPAGAGEIYSVDSAVPALGSQAQRAAVPAVPSAQVVPTVACLLALLLLVAAGGCRQKGELEVAYGQRRGSAGGSVNGTSVLAGMFREAGMRAVSVKYLSPRLDNYRVLVWAPDDFALPSDEAREFLEKWLANESDEAPRILVYIGRDYDAACDYWPMVLPAAPPDQRVDLMRRAAGARSRHANARIQMPKDQGCEWFVMRRDYPGRRVDQLEGWWSDGVDASKADIWSEGRLDIPSQQDLAALWKNDPPLTYLQPAYQPLLQSGDNTLVYEVSKPAWRDSRILVVSNGSFLLNLPLVNHQHRALAGQLIDTCQIAETVAFLESQSGGPLVLGGNSSDVSDQTVRRRVLLALHWVVWGMVFCFGVLPIFGRPRSLEEESVADFGQHVEALAGLLERTGDKGYAQQQLDLFRKTAPAEKGRVSAPAGSSPFADVSTSESNTS